MVLFFIVVMDKRSSADPMPSDVIDIGSLDQWISVLQGLRMTGSFFELEPFRDPHPFLVVLKPQYTILKESKVFA